MWCDDPGDLFKLMTVVMNDDAPKRPTEAAYLFGNTPEVEDSVLQSAARLIKNGETRQLVVLRLQPGYYEGPDRRVASYADFAIWREKLLMLGVGDDPIIPIMSPPAKMPGEQPPLSHTHTEAERFVETARRNRWDTVHVVASPYHVARCFTNIVSFVTKRQLPISVYAAPTVNQPWFGEALLQQGLSRGTRYDGIAGEWSRINRWHEKGDLISCREVLQYIEQRKH